MLAKLEITLQINTDQFDEMLHQGYSAGMLQDEIKNTITLMPSHLRKPVNDIFEVKFVEYKREE
jgi:hypothetical protein